MKPPELHVELDPRITLAGCANAVPVIRSLGLENPDDQTIENVTVRIVTDPAVADPWEKRVAAIPPGSTWQVDPVDLRLSPGLLGRQAEAEAGRLDVEVRTGETLLARSSHDIEVLAPTYWPGGRSLPELLAAWVLPNHPALVPILREASKRMPDGALAGYQEREAVPLLVKAVYEALQASGVTYISPPASFEEQGQKVRTPDQVVSGGMGTCIDLTVVLAALLEQVGLHPLLVVISGHAFPGVWLIEEPFPQPVIFDPAVLRKRGRLGELWLFDSSAVASGMSFSSARDVAMRHMDEVASAEASPGSGPAFYFAVDVTTARRRGIRPLPTPGTETLPHVSGGQPVAAAGDDDAVETPPPVDEELARTRATTRTRLDAWRSRLLDLTLRNRLLNFREGKATIPLIVDDLGAVEDGLAEEQSFNILPRPELLAGRDERLYALLAGEDAAARFVAEERSAGSLHANLPPGELERRLRDLWRQAKATLEETGAITLYLAIGMLRWFESDQSEVERRAPILLVPVRLDRDRGKASYSLSLAEDETRVNVTLLRKLEADFGLDVAGLDVPPADDAGVDVPRILRDFTRLVEDVPRWDVLDEVHLAQFSFTKFLMWLDLEAHADRLLENPVVRHIFEGNGMAYPLAAPAVPEGELDGRPAAETFTVKDADPTQLQAICAAADGSSFVLQGPPGTGKSQTITNLVAQLLADDKRVLFVSEKMAALEVVHHRLVDAGLGPFCLELHSDKASKKKVMEQLKSSFEARTARAPREWTELSRQLEESRKRLNDFAALMRREGPFGLSLFTVCSRLIGMRDVPRVDLALDAPDADSLERLRATAERLARAADAVGDVTSCPWVGAHRSEWSPAWSRDVEDALGGLAAAIARVEAASTEALPVLGLPAEGLDTDRIEQLGDLCQSLLSSPIPPLALVYVGNIQEIEDRVGAWLGHVKSRVQSWDRLRDRFTASILKLDLDALRSRFERWASSFFLFAWVALWGSRKALRPAARAKLPPNRQLADALSAAIVVRDEDEALRAVDGEARTLLGRVWHGAETDTVAVGRLVEWARGFRATVARATTAVDDLAASERLARLASDQQARVAPDSPGGRKLREFVEAGAGLAAARDKLGSLLSLEVPVASLAHQREQVSAWEKDIPRLRYWCSLQAAVNEAGSAGMGPLAEGMLSGDLAPEQLRAVLDRAVYQGWWEAQLADNALLRDFSADDQEAAIARFQKLDSRSIELGRQIVRSRLAARVPEPTAPGDEMALLRRQLQLTRRHMPLRKLFAKIPDALRRLKPCVLMSPLSVARYLDPSLEGFDVVVFDEASQIPPWDAIGAIARGRQVVIVGDSKQLPPTTFFDRAAEDEPGVPDDQDVVEMESVLDEAVAAGLHEFQLRWHYRSRHESLIAFSNHQYYDDRLHTFPAAAHNRPGIGVELRAVPSGFYDRGASRTNQGEAEAVVEELFRVLAQEKKSVGVVTFSLPQQRLIEDLVDERRQAEPEYEDCFSGVVDEPVFVKNLENVQGDERDVMLFSVCYGPDVNGRVSMGFGPLNRSGGERRLNVAITRARERLAVFSTLRPDQIDLGRTRAVGVGHLKTYLDYAGRGMAAIAAVASPTGREADSPFEEQVASRLRAEGYEVHPQVGCSGYRIDLAVVDPNRPGAYALAVECDGATYHSSANARERDRLRQSVLEHLGWHFHRVWSTDWWLDPEREMGRLRKAIDAAMTAPNPRAGNGLAGAKDPPVETEAVAATDRTTSRSDPGSSRDDDTDGQHVSYEEMVEQTPIALPDNAEVYRVIQLGAMGPSEGFYQHRDRVADLLRQVVGACGPIHDDLAGHAVAAAWGLQQLGSTIRRQLTEARVSLPPDERPVLRGDFLWPAGVDPTGWRGIRIPDDNPDSQRPAQYIPPEEIANAAAWVLTRAVGGLDRDDLCRETAQVFGISRLGHRVRQVMESGVDLLLSDGRAQEVAGQIRAASQR